MSPHAKQVVEGTLIARLNDVGSTITGNVGHIAVRQRDRLDEWQWTFSSRSARLLALFGAVHSSPGGVRGMTTIILPFTLEEALEATKTMARSNEASGAF